MIVGKKWEQHWTFMHLNGDRAVSANDVATGIGCAISTARQCLFDDHRKGYVDRDDSSKPYRYRLKR
jgi:DNA-binding IclR family transcriptional regulator